MYFVDDGEVVDLSFKVLIEKRKKKQSFQLGAMQ